jgi:hypothetical protein
MAQHPSSHRITEEPLTLDEEYEQQRINAMPEPLQRLALLHHMDQFEATPPYVDRYRPASKPGEDQAAI